MTERDKKPAPDRDRAGQPGETDDVIIPGRHGKHGGAMESEGSPQEQAPEANTPPIAMAPTATGIESSWHDRT